jgi:hypothetical protein
MHACNEQDLLQYMSAYACVQMCVVLALNGTLLKTYEHLATNGTWVVSVCMCE